MMEREPVRAHDVDTAVAHVLDVLRPATDRDWSLPAGSLEWSCRRTADHVGHCLMAYAGQLAVRPTDRYVNFDALADDDASPAEVLTFVEAGGRILAAMVDATPPYARAFHPYGSADPEGFAAMGCVETLVHGHDMATGLGLAIAPSGELCARVLARMFPTHAAALVGTDPWQGLLWATGRVDLPGREPVGRWRWHGAPLADATAESPGGRGGGRDAPHA